MAALLRGVLVGRALRGLGRGEPGRAAGRRAAAGRPTEPTVLLSVVCRIGGGGLRRGFHCAALRLQDDKPPSSSSSSSSHHEHYQAEALQDDPTSDPAAEEASRPNTR
ncbi:hypothetical protein EYF80_054935 [Liparis tanakae]|uniref:Uncharacterized protein n=1 Tax=Liparis tanakae TaxID=230148 RepID=A0A4Z2F1Q8_9TELE|nr:hypothetical protein EYF80_054935 [Liparis tanakae]